MGGTVTDTAANMVSMMSFLTDLGWAGCANHIIQLIVNVRIFSLFSPLLHPIIGSICCTDAPSPPCQDFVSLYRATLWAWRRFAVSSPPASLWVRHITLLSTLPGPSTRLRLRLSFWFLCIATNFVYGFKVVLQICLQVMGRRESEQPWSLLQEVSTRCDPFVLW